MAKQSTFFMGHFEITDSFRIKEKLKEQDWYREEPDKIINHLRDIFYEDFYKFCFSSKIGKGCVAYKKPIDKSVTIRPGKRNEIVIQVKEIKIFLLPFNMIMFYIEIEQSDASANDICFINRRLRNIRKYNDMLDPWSRVAIQPLIDLYKEFNVVKGEPQKAVLVGRGNRLKTFQIITQQVEGKAVLPETERQEQLYLYGTLTYHSGETEDNEISVTPQHLAKIMEENSIYIHKGWSCLALLDTITFVLYDETIDSYIQEFKNYCRTIYIHALFQKYYLFQLNQKHYEMQKESMSVTSYIKSLFSLGNTNVEILAHDMRIFATKYSFSNIAYNNLPIMMQHYVSKALQIEGEKDAVYNIVQAEKEEIEEMSDKTINVVLLILSLFSFISAILDGCVLINSIHPYKNWLPSETIGYGMFSAVFIVIMLCIITMFVVIGRRRSKRGHESLIRPLVSKKRSR